MRSLIKATLMLVSLSSGVSVMAHHSVAAFDEANPIIVEGTVKQWSLANPHAWIHVLVPNDKGGADEWAIEGMPGNGLKNAGYTKYTLKPGDKVRLLVAPRRDGGQGGNWQRILSVNGGPLQLNRTENQ